MTPTELHEIYLTIVRRLEAIERKLDAIYTARTRDKAERYIPEGVDVPGYPAPKGEPVAFDSEELLSHLTPLQREEMAMRKKAAGYVELVDDPEALREWAKGMADGMSG